jgi:hypothetical protein
LFKTIRKLYGSLTSKKRRKKSTRKQAQPQWSQQKTRLT